METAALRSRTNRRARATVWIVATCAAIACSAIVFSIPTSALVGSSDHLVPAQTTSDCPTLNLSTPICHVYILMDENQGRGWIIHHAPYQEYLATTYAVADQYYSLMHYSLPNYLADTSGKATNYKHIIPTTPPHTGTIVDLLNAHSPALSWMAYMQSMPGPCDNISTHQYKTAHNPFIWYSSIYDNKTLCRAHDVGFSSFNSLVKAQNWSALPNYAWFSPNSTDDCWLSGVKSCDPWLQSWLSPLINDTFFQSTAFFITYDEGPVNDTRGINGTVGGGRIFTALVSPYACAGYGSQVQYNDFNLLTTTEWLLGLGQLGSNDSWTQHPPMKDLFCFPPAPPAGRLGLSTYDTTLSTVQALLARRADSVPIRAA
jgi:hypothetical protein